MAKGTFVLEWEPSCSELLMLPQIEAIFWEASLSPPAPGPEKQAFHERWLGRYLGGGTDVVLLAMSDPATVAGYLVGALENPAQQPRFADLGYFHNEFAHLLSRFPAHLHINVAAHCRGAGIGAQLIEGFADRARRAGAGGMHVVTGRAMRNVRFYERCGFKERAIALRQGRDLALLGREL
jgi:GNAT superfamily N-acetyltransferase